jgi:hypothetical protein
MTGGAYSEDLCVGKALQRCGVAAHFLVKVLQSEGVSCTTATSVTEGFTIEDLCVGSIGFNRHTKSQSHGGFI